MYSSIAEVYNYIFPQNKAQLAFIESISPIDHEDRIIEVGCATGNLTDLLSSKSHHVMGIDLDEQLLAVGKRVYPNLNTQHLNMMAIPSLNKTFDKVICFGNTLVHLSDRKMVQDFFNNTFKVLKDGGHFITQIIHYDRIINDNIDFLPTIDNEYITFVRDYELKEATVNFKTTLTIKSTKEVLTNCVPLLTLQKDEIENMLLHAGFKNIQFYGNLKGDPLTDSSIPLLFSCEKFNEK